jgi:type I restriction enzyme, S subunit
MSKGGGWRTGKLGDLAYVNPVSVSARADPDWRFRYIDLSSVYRGQINWENTSELTLAHAPSRARRPVDVNDVLFGTVRPALQSHGIISASFPEPLVASTGFSVLRARIDTDPYYLFHLVMSNAVLAEARRFEVGSNYPAVNESDVRQFAVPIPPQGAQMRIAEILDAADKAIRSTERLIAKLEQARVGLLHDLLTRGINESGNLRESGVAPEEFRDSSIGLMPSSWSVGPLGSYVMLQRGFDITVVEQRPGNVPVISSSGVSSFHDRAMVKGPGVVIGRKGKLGDAYYVEVDFWPHDTSLWVKQFKNIIPEFAAVLLKSMRLERFDAATSVPTLNRNFIHPILVAIPSTEEQERILSRLDAASCTIRCEIANLAKLRLVKLGLMDDLLTGRVRVGGLA